MFENTDNIVDIFRGGLPYMLLALPIFIICSSNPVLASSEFSVQRMAQFDVNGIFFGCRSSSLSLEAKSLYSWSTNRHCVIARFQDMTADLFRQIRHKAGGLVLLLPKDADFMSREDKEHLNIIEQVIMEQAVSIPVYFSTYNPKLEDIIDDITRSFAKKNCHYSSLSNSHMKYRESALNEVFQSISANGYQLVVTGASHAPNKHSKIPIIHGDITPSRVVKFVDGTADSNNQLPIIVIAAHLNTFGMYNTYPLNTDAAVLITLADIFNKLHNSSNTGLKNRILFLLTESSSFLNYQGDKKWLEEIVLLQNVVFVFCLDSIIQPLNGNNSNLYIHVSKLPKDKTPMNAFFSNLKQASKKYGNITIETVHKKINLADPLLAWQHERFSIKRLASFTISSLNSPKHPARISIFRDNETIILAKAKCYTKIIAEALACYIYNNSALSDSESFEIFSGSMHISENVIKSYMNVKSALENSDLKNAFEKYLRNVKVIYEKPDIREPDFMLYEDSDAILNVYRVKPAVFDLFLTILICSYLVSVYFIIQYFPNMYKTICKMALDCEDTSPAQSNHIQLKPKTY